MTPIFADDLLQQRDELLDIILTVAIADSNTGNHLPQPLRDRIFDVIGRMVVK